VLLFSALAESGQLDTPAALPSGTQFSAHIGGPQRSGGERSLGPTGTRTRAPRSGLKGWAQCSGSWLQEDQFPTQMGRDRHLLWVPLCVHAGAQVAYLTPCTLQGQATDVEENGSDLPN
jgi:hypothetical protein